jgi:hypothetical protein
MTDVLFDSSNDLAILNGDWSIGESTDQEVEDIILSFPGYFKEFPLVGVGAPAYLKGPGNGQALQRNISVQLAADNKQVSSYTTTFTNGVLTIIINGVEVDVS